MVRDEVLLETFLCIDEPLGRVPPRASPPPPP